MKQESKSEKDQPKNSAPGEALGPDSTTGSGISEAARRANDGSSPQQPADPQDVESTDHAAGDSRH